MGGEIVSVNRDEVDRLVGNIQFDRWIFGVPTRFTVVSHGHEDHDPFRGAMSFPEPLIFGWKFKERFAERVREMIKGKLPDHFNLSDGDFTTVGRVRVRCLGRESIIRLSRVDVEWFHADWWVLSTKRVVVLFVGELDGPELPALSGLLDEVSNIDAVMLASYGRIKDMYRHRLTDPEQLQREVAEIAERERERGRLVYALPHPVVPRWADMVAHHI